MIFGSGSGSYLAGHYGSGSYQAGHFGSGSLLNLVTDSFRIQQYFMKFFKILREIFVNFSFLGSVCTVHGKFIFVPKSTFLSPKWCLYHCIFIPRGLILNDDFESGSYRSGNFGSGSGSYRTGQVITDPDPQHCSDAIQVSHWTFSRKLCRALESFFSCFFLVSFSLFLA